MPAHRRNITGWLQKSEIRLSLTSASCVLQAQYGYMVAPGELDPAVPQDAWGVGPPGPDPGGPYAATPPPPPHHLAPLPAFYVQVRVDHTGTD